MIRMLQTSLKVMPYQAMCICGVLVLPVRKQDVHLTETSSLHRVAVSEITSQKNGCTYWQTVHQWPSRVFPVSGCIYSLSRWNISRMLAVHSTQVLKVTPWAACHKRWVVVKWGHQGMHLMISVGHGLNRLIVIFCQLCVGLCGSALIADICKVIIHSDNDLVWDMAIVVCVTWGWAFNTCMSAVEAAATSRARCDGWGTWVLVQCAPATIVAGTCLPERRGDKDAGGEEIDSLASYDQVIYDASFSVPSGRTACPRSGASEDICSLVVISVGGNFWKSKNVPLFMRFLAQHYRCSSWRIAALL